MPPAQTGKLFIVTVGGNPFAAGFNGQGGQPDIGNQIEQGRLRPAESCPLFHQGKQRGGVVPFNFGADALSAHGGQTNQRLPGDGRLGRDFVAQRLLDEMRQVAAFRLCQLGVLVGQGFIQLNGRLHL